MTKLFVLYVCAAVSPIDCREIPIRATTELAARIEWCAAIDRERRAGDVWHAFVLRIDRRHPMSREPVEWWCAS